MKRNVAYLFPRQVHVKLAGDLRRQVPGNREGLARLNRHKPVLGHGNVAAMANPSQGNRNVDHEVLICSRVNVKAVSLNHSVDAGGNARESRASLGTTREPVDDKPCHAQPTRLLGATHPDAISGLSLNGKAVMREVFLDVLDVSREGGLRHVDELAQIVERYPFDAVEKVVQQIGNPFLTRLQPCPRSGLVGKPRLEGIVIGYQELIGAAPTLLDGRDADKGRICLSHIGADASFANGKEVRQVGGVNAGMRAQVLDELMRPVHLRLLPIRCLRVRR